MDRKRIALISGQSLLVEGVASRLRSHRDRVMSNVLSPDGEEMLASLRTLQPDVVIFDSLDAAARDAFALLDLLRLLPQAKVLVLDSERSELQIVSSQTRAISDAAALLEQVLEML